MKTRPGGHGIPIALCFVICLASSAPASLGPSLESKLRSTSGDVDVIVLLQAAVAPPTSITAGRPDAYSDNRDRIQADNESATRRFLEAANAQGILLGNVTPFWLAPFVSVTVNAHDIPALEQLPGVQTIIDDAPIELIAPRTAVTVTAAADATSAGQLAIHAQEAWRRGITGKGTLVANIDTGVDGHHPALAQRYRGLNADPSAAWLDPAGNSFPNDLAGHGTHTMGTAVGRDGTDTVGIAPDAEWIAAGVVDRGKSFGETIQDLLLAFQWLADPDGNPATQRDLPDVVLNSWGIPQGVLPPCDATFWEAIDNLEALGIVVVFAAGNEGPLPSTLRLPVDRGDEPLKCFSVGAVNGADPSLATALFSSRGPVTCNPIIIKPELMAPGVNIRSCKPGGGYQLRSGTSMAAPHVAGAVALLRQANPDATPDQIKQALIQSAFDLGESGPDFTTGYGLLNIAGALDLLPPARPISWEWNVPTLPEQGTEEAVSALDPLHVQLLNRGRACEDVSIDLEPVSALDQLSEVVHAEVDFVPADVGSVDLTLAFTAIGDRPCGEKIWLRLHVTAAMPPLDTSVVIGIPVGSVPQAAALAQAAGHLTAVASNCARFDAALAQTLGVESLEFAYEGEVIPFSGGLRFLAGESDRTSFGSASPFEPAPGGLLVPGSGDVLSSTRFRDTRLVDPAGVEFEQTVYRPGPGVGDYLLYTYSWSRMWPENFASALRFGVWLHWDLAGAEALPVAGIDNALVVTNGLTCVGALWLGDVPARQARAFDSTLPALPLPAPDGATSAPAESYLLTLTGAESRASRGNFAVALIAAPDLAEWERAARSAQDQYAAMASGVQDVRPAAFELLGNYPNPFNPATKIRYALDRDLHVKVEIFNLLGRRVRTLWNALQGPGVYEMAWNAEDDRGRALSSGVYFLRITAGDQARNCKMTLLR